MVLTVVSVASANITHESEGRDLSSRYPKQRMPTPGNLCRRDSLLSTIPTRRRNARLPSFRMVAGSACINVSHLQFTSREKYYLKGFQSCLTFNSWWTVRQRDHSVGFRSNFAFSAYAKYSLLGLDVAATPFRIFFLFKQEN